MNDSEYKSPVGIDQVYIAEVLTDTSAEYLADTPEYLAPVAELSAKPKSSQDTQYADNRAYDVAVSEAETELEVTITNLPAEMYAKLLGKQFVSATGRVVDMPGVPPYFALGFRSEKMNGSKRYYWYQKVMFSAPEEALKTIGEKKEPQTVKLTAKAIKTAHEYTVNGVTDGVKRVFGDEDTDSFDETDWFTQVQTPASGSVSALALSTSVPADDATGVVVTSNLTLTFNNILKAEAVNNVTLLDDAQAPVAAAVTLDATKKIITVNPTASLDASTEYTIVIGGVMDIYGQTLTEIVTFTTAS